MSDYQRIVEDVRSALHTHSLEMLDFVSTAAANYSAACDEVNERLRRCAELLKKGLRSEALQQCEIEPNLLEATAALDLAELRQWNEVLFQYGMVPAAPLAMDAAADLNEAYGTEQPLAALLRRHRLLALGRGPLRARINVMHGLAELDKDNRIWLEDLPAFEQERHRQLRQEAQEAQQQQDIPGLIALETEARQGPWSEPPPPALLQSIVGTRAALVRQEACRELERLLPDLSAAVSQGDIDAGRRVRQQWYTALRIAELPADSLVPLRAAKALGWLGEQDALEQQQARHAQAVTTLERALAQRTSAAQLERFHALASAGGQEIPFEVRKACQRRLADLRRAALRRRWMAVAAATCVVMLIAGIVAAIIVHQRYARAVEIAVAELQDLIEKEKLPQAREYFKALPPSVAAEPGIADWERQLAKKEEREDRRARRFGAKVEEFRNQLRADALNGGLESMFKEVGESAVLPSERELLVELRKEWDAAREKEQGDRNAEVSRELARIAEGIEALGKGHHDETSEGRLHEIRLELWKLRERKDVSEKPRQELNALLDRLAKIPKQWGDLEERNKLVQSVTASLGSVERYAQALADLRDGWHDPHAQSELDEARQEASLWKGVEAWNRLTALLCEKKLTELIPDAAAERVTQAKGVLERYGDFPPAAAVREVLPYLEAVVRRLEGDQRIEEPLRRLFADKIVSQIWLVETTDGKGYYTLSQPIFPSKDLGMVKYLVGFDLATRTKTLPRDQLAKVARAPHTAMAGEVSRLLANLHDDNWEETFCEVLNTIKRARDVDSILQFSLLERTLKTGCRGSHCLENAFHSQWEAVSKANFNQKANWLDPEDSQAPFARAGAKELLAASLRLDAAIAETRLDREHLARLQLGKRCRWLGWLHHEDAGWQCLTKAAGPGDQADEGSELVVVERAGGGPTFTHVGRILQGRPRLAGDAADAHTPYIYVAHRGKVHPRLAGEGTAASSPDDPSASTSAGDRARVGALREGRPVYIVSSDAEK